LLNKSRKKSEGETTSLPFPFTKLLHFIRVSPCYYALENSIRGVTMAQSLKIGAHTLRYPLIQGGMGARISAGRLAGHVAKCGGVGLVAAAGIALNSGLYNGKNFFQAEAEAFKAELRKAYEIAPDGVIGVNVMVSL
jgi:hypothetical protein